VKNYSLVEKLRYWFDNQMSKGLIALIGLLGIATFVFIAIVACAVVIFGLHPENETLNYPEAFWASMLRTLDPGTMGQDRGVGFRAAMLVVTLGGIILVASLISIISNSFNNRVDDLRKGRSRVLESDHTVILGWSSKVVPIVHELCIANGTRKNAAILILSDRDKVETEDELHHKIKHHGSTKLIVRSGDPMSLFDLDIANPRTARSIIILAPDDVEDPDTVVIRTALALVNNPHRKEGKYHIVGEIKDPSNLEAARLVGGDEADWVMSKDLISRITVQTSRQSGLSVVFTELLDFEGDEMYFTTQPKLTGKTFFDAQLNFRTSAAIGLVTNDEIILNPPADRILHETDQIIVIAEDDTSIRLDEPGVPNSSQLNTGSKLKATPERTLVIGYNESLALILPELDSYVPKGSQVQVVSEYLGQISTKFKNISVSTEIGDTTSRARLEALDLNSFDHIIVLAYSEKLSPQRADAKTLITLLHLRDIAKQKGTTLNIVSEMMDDKNRQLAEVTDADDFIVSDKLVSLMLSQLSENARLAEVFEALFSSIGSEICLRPAELYIPLDQPVDFYTVLLAAKERGETAFGYRIQELAHKSEEAYGVVVNPDKTNSVTYSPGDKIIVLAEA